jgi:hypothetical protein
MRNVRFWDFINGGPVKLTLRPDQILRHYQSEPTDEGWRSEENSWEYIAAEGRVLSDYCSDGVDCDGRLSYGGQRYFYVFDASAGGELDGIRYPAWERVERNEWRRDWQAEAAGY